MVNRKGRRSKPPRHVRTMPPANRGVHVSVVSASGHLADAADLVRPAVLYADKVTLYSPAAALLDAALNITRSASREQQIQRLFDISEQVPALATKLTMTPDTRHMLAQLMKDPSATKKAIQTSGTTEAQVLGRAIEQLDAVLETGLPDAVASAVESVGGSELAVAITAGAVEVAPLASASRDGVVASMLRAATGVHDKLGDDVVASFVARVTDVLADRRAFPLLDTEAAALIRAIEREGGKPAQAAGALRAVEIASAAAFMGYLPAFEQMPMDETLDLRRVINAPLIRFRAAMTTMSESFSTRPIDDDFVADVEDAWRRDVAPRLLEIRETLAEHSLLREVASVAMGDPTRLVAEAGGIFVTAMGTSLSLSGVMSAMLSAGVPIADVTLRALKARNKGVDIAKQSAFYFLHEVGERAAR